MSDLQNAWKNEKVFHKQLEYNLKELESRESYAPHWKTCVSLIQHFGPKSVLDVGCGCGSLSEVFRRELPDVKYTGSDYSEDAIRLAKKTWPHADFFVHDLMKFDKSQLEKYDLIYSSAVLDVMPNGDEAMEHLMNVCSGPMLISRVKLTDKPSYHTTYKAYDEIETCAYHHNKTNFLDMCERYSYNAYSMQDNFYLVKK